MRLALSITLVFAIAGSALAQDEKAEEAKKHYDDARAAYTAGDFGKAADSFMAAYKARPFPGFLFNAAVAQEQAKDFAKAIELFNLYLQNDAEASDKDDVKKRITFLQGELDRQATGTTQPAAEVLPKAKVKGFVSIGSKPVGATIWLDDKNRQPLGQTPWEGDVEGKHTIILESKGYKTIKHPIQPNPERGWTYYFELSEEHYLGWLEVRSNVTNSLVYLDDTKGGKIGQTTFLGYVQPGKHTIIVGKEGYIDWKQEVVIERGQTHQLTAKLEAAPIGFIRIRTGDTSEGAKVKLDGKETCAKAPCRFEAPEGKHQLTISKGGKKSFKRDFDIQRQTETIVSVRLAPTPSRTDAIWQFLTSAVFVTGGVLAYQAGADDECPFDSPKEVCTYGSYGLFGLGALTAAYGVYFLFRDKGPASTGTIESRDLSVAPVVGPGFAGVTTGLSF